MSLNTSEKYIESNAGSKLKTVSMEIRISRAYAIFCQNSRNSQNKMKGFLHLLLSLRRKSLLKMIDSNREKNINSNWLNRTLKIMRDRNSSPIDGYPQWSMQIEKFEIEDDVFLQIIQILGVNSIDLYNGRMVEMPTTKELASWFEMTIDKKVVEDTGSFYTPYKVIDLILGRIGYGKQAVNSSKCSIFDPSMGSGKFLISALDFAMKSVHKRSHVKWAEENIFGSDINKDCVDFVRFALWYHLSDFSNLPSFENNFSHCDSLLMIQDKKEYDFVIGNPPYIENKKLDTRAKSYIKKNFETAIGQFDLAIPFMELGIKKSTRAFSFIVTNKFLTSEYGEAFRNFILNNNWRICLYNTSAIPVFSNASVYTVIITVEKDKKSNDVEIFSLNHDLFVAPEGSVSKKFYRKLPGLIIPTRITNSHFKLIDKVISFGGYPRNLVRCGLAQTGLTKCLTDSPGKDVIGYLSGANLEALRVAKPQKYLPIRHLSKSRIEDFSKSKILIPGLVKDLYASKDKAGYALGRIYYLVPEEVGIHADVLMGLFNSDLYNYLLRMFFGDAHLSGGYIRINSPVFDIFPKPRNEMKRQFELIASAVQSGQVDKMNNLIYSLFGIEKSEIKKIEGFLKDSLEFAA